MFNKKFSLLTAAFILLLPFSYCTAIAATTENVMSMQQTKWFFSVHADKGTITNKEKIIVLRLENPSIIAVPTTSHHIRNVTLSEFISGWSKGSNSYKINNPSAVINCTVNNKALQKAVVLSNPIIDDHALSFDVVGLNKSQ